MADNHEFPINLTPEQQSVVLMELRTDLRDIKNALGPISEWKSKMQGALFIIGFIITLLIGSGGFLTWRWWDSGIEIANLRYQIDSQKEKNVVMENQLAIARSNTDTNNSRLSSVENKLKDYDKDSADIKSRISSLETGAITQHIHK